MKVFDLINILENLDEELEVVGYWGDRQQKLTTVRVQADARDEEIITDKKVVGLGF